MHAGARGQPSLVIERSCPQCETQAADSRKCGTRTSNRVETKNDASPRVSALPPPASRTRCGASRVRPHPASVHDAGTGDLHRRHRVQPEARPRTRRARRRARYGGTLPEDQATFTSPATNWATAVQQVVVERSAGDLTAAQVCVALVDGNPPVVVDASHRVNLPAGQSNCYDDGSGDAGKRVQVAVARPGSLEALFFTMNLNLRPGLWRSSSPATERAEALTCRDYCSDHATSTGPSWCCGR